MGYSRGCLGVVQGVRCAYSDEHHGIRLVLKRHCRGTQRVLKGILRSIVSMHGSSFTSLCVCVSLMLPFTTHALRRVAIIPRGSTGVLEGYSGCSLLCPLPFVFFSACIYAWKHQCVHLCSMRTRTQWRRAVLRQNNTADCCSDSCADMDADSRADAHVRLITIAREAHSRRPAVLKR